MGGVEQRLSPEGPELVVAALEDRVETRHAGMRRECQNLDAVASSNNEPAGGVGLTPGVGRPGARESRGRYAQANGGRGCEPSRVDEQDPDRCLRPVACDVAVSYTHLT